MITKITVKVIPNAKSNEVVGFMDDGVIKIRIKAKPVDGKANSQLIKFLSEKTCVHKNEISILSGEKNRKKTIQIMHLNENQVKKRLGLS